MSESENGTKIDLEIYYIKEEKVTLDHGYAEVPTRHKGKMTGEKVILDSEGVYVKTVSDGFTLLTHEELMEKLNSKFGSQMYRIRDGKSSGLSKKPRRMYFYIKMDKEVEVIVTNSIDGSLALQVWPVVNGALLVGKRFPKVYRMHTEHFDVDKMVQATDKVLEYTAKYRMIINDLEKISIKENEWILDKLTEEFAVKKMPKKYGELILKAAKMGMDGVTNMAQVYAKISREIWNSDMEERTKKLWFEVLNDYMLLAWDLRPQEVVATT